MPTPSIQRRPVTLPEPPAALQGAWGAPAPEPRQPGRQTDELYIIRTVIVPTPRNTTRATPPLSGHVMSEAEYAEAMRQATKGAHGAIPSDKSSIYQRNGALGGRPRNTKRKKLLRKCVEYIRKAGRPVPRSEMREVMKCTQSAYKNVITHMSKMPEMKYDARARGWIVTETGGQ